MGQILWDIQWVLKLKLVGKIIIGGTYTNIGCLHLLIRRADQYVASSVASAQDTANCRLPRSRYDVHASVMTIPPVIHTNNASNQPNKYIVHISYRPIQNNPIIESINDIVKAKQFYLQTKNNIFGNSFFTDIQGPNSYR